MIIWKPVVGEYLQRVKEPRNEVDKTVFSLVRTNSHCKGEVVVLYRCFDLDTFATGKRVNHRDEYGLEIPTNLQFLNFHDSEKAIKLAKK